MSAGPAYHVRNVLFGERRIAARVRRLVEEICADHPSDPIVMIGVLRGSFIFIADLVRALHRRGRCAVIDFVTIESYGAGTTSSGKLKMVKGYRVEVRGRDVLLVDDILDTGRTLEFARRHLLRRGARSVRICALLDKPSRRVRPIEADYVGFRVPDVFVVGYGLDYAGRHRELPYIARVEFERA